MRALIKSKVAEMVNLEQIATYKAPCQRAKETVAADELQASKKGGRRS
jgi:hypothetical protein